MAQRLLAAALLLGSALSVNAASTSATINFDTGVQSLWGAGSAADFGASGYVVGDSSLGVSYEAMASSGSLRSWVSGTLTATHADQVGWFQRRRVTVGFDVADLDGALLSALGASMQVQAHLNQTLLGVPIAWNPTLLNRNYALEIDQALAPTLPQSLAAADSFAPAAVTLDLPSFGLVLDGGAGVALEVVQSSTLHLQALRGLVVATHRESGETVARRLKFGEDLRFSLPLAGIWDFDLRRLNLPNSFATGVRLDIRGDIEYGLGTGCGNYGTDSDNGWLCVADERVARQLTAIDLYASGERSLAYGSVDLPAMFSIEVAAAPGGVAAVPETGTAGLMLAGLAVLAGLGRGAARARRPLG